MRSWRETVEIAGGCSDDLLPFGVGLAASLTDEEPDAAVKGPVACIGHVSWSAKG